MVIPAQRSFPYDGTGNDAGPYDADYFAQIQQAFLGAYTRRATAGVMLGVGNGTQESLNVEETSPQSLGVLVREGWAMVNGRMYQATVDATVAIVQNTDASGDDRIDSIIIRVDKSTPNGRLVAKQGTVAPVPVAPSLTQNSTIWEIRIANVTVINGATVITTANIDNTVRAYAVLRGVKEGGTGLSTIALGQLFAGSAANVMSAVPAPNDYDLLIGNALATPKMSWVNPRPSVIVGDVGGVSLGTGLSGTVVPLNTTALLNPNSWVTSIAANQFFLAAGFYVFFVIIPALNNSGALRSVLGWIHNATQNRVDAQGIQTRSIAASGDTIAWIFPNQFVESNGTDAFELRAVASGATVSIPALTAMTPSPTGGVSGTHVQIAIRRVK